MRTPAWAGKADTTIEVLEAMKEEWVLCPAIQDLLGVSERQARRVAEAAGGKQAGRMWMVMRVALIVYLDRFVDSTEAERQKKMARTVAKLREDREKQPQVHVEMPDRKIAPVARYDFEALPAGLTVAPGRICIDFQTPIEALEKLALLALAIGRAGQEEFAKRVSGAQLPLERKIG
jgi:hypothetical protein